MKDLSTILENYKHFSLAKESDNKEILDFFKTSTMDTSTFSLRYDRSSDFFSFCREQSKTFYVFLMKDEKGIIKGCASIALIPHRVDGKEELCAYLGDLRISPLLNAKIRLLWRKCYSEIVENFSELEEFKGIKFLYTAILKENINALASLTKNNDKLYYHELTEYETVNVMAAKFFARKNTSGFVVTENNDEEIKGFLLKTSNDHGLRNSFSEIERRSRVWGNFSFSDFMSVRDSTGRIVAVVAPWNCQSKKLVIEKMTGWLKLIGRILPLINVPKISEAKAIRILYLTHLTFAENLDSNQKRAVMEVMVRHLLKNRKRDFHLISFFNFPSWGVSAGELPFYYQIVQAKFFQVLNKEQYEKHQFFDLEGEAPAFELGIA